jgi:hypothetical protein
LLGIGGDLAHSDPHRGYEWLRLARACTETPELTAAAPPVPVTLLESHRLARMAPLPAEQPLHLVPVRSFVPRWGEKGDGQPSSRPSSRDRVTAWLREEAPSLR